MISVWFLMGFYMLIFLGGLQDIPREYYEAARIDGAGPVQSFLKITLPLLQPTSFFVLARFDRRPPSADRRPSTSST